MIDTRIILSGIWASLMLTYLLGDVLRIFAGDFVAGEMQGMTASPWMWIVATLMMLIPIVMIVLSLTLTYPLIRWLTIITAIVLFLFNLVGLPSYPGLYDKLLIAVGLVFNILTVWYAWKWVP
ncbi:MAG: DUF6326 family protein [Candidatus Promineifilaceae bacterium]|jgi:hypothetical protein